MTRAINQPNRCSSEADSESLSDQSSGDSNSNSDSSNDSDREEETGEIEQISEGVEDIAAKMLCVQADIDEMCSMMAHMDAIKAQLQERFHAARKAEEDRIAQGEIVATGSKTYKVVCVDSCVQTKPISMQQPMHLSKQAPPDVADDVISGSFAATLPANYEAKERVESKKLQPAGLSLYDLVKVPHHGLSLKSFSPRADSRALNSSHLGQHNNEKQQSKNHPCINAEEDKIVGNWGHGSDSDSGRRSQLDDSLKSARNFSKHSYIDRLSPQLRQTDENLASLRDSLDSSTASNQFAVLPNTIEPCDHKQDAAALLSKSNISLPLIPNGNVEKSDEQREMEAIRYLLFNPNV
ncbi:hypothetical protein Plhal710r2_c031g0115441 [Plasmopara halstedii]